LLGIATPVFLFNIQSQQAGNVYCKRAGRVDVILAALSPAIRQSKTILARSCEAHRGITGTTFAAQPRLVLASIELRDLIAAVRA
jgi:hypothetical protein